MMRIIHMKEVSEYVRVDNTDDRKSGNRSYNEYSEDYRISFHAPDMYNQSRWGAFDDYYWNSKSRSAIIMDTIAGPIHGTVIITE